MTRVRGIYYVCVISVVQESARAAGNEEEAGGGSSAVYSERRDADCGPGSGQAGLGKGFQSGKRRLDAPFL